MLSRPASNETLMPADDYYKTLEIKREATEAEIIVAARTAE